jgi:hypothetical protein
MKNLLVATVLLAGLSGCALLRSQVAVLHQLPMDLSGTTYVMIPFKEQEKSLEHKVYEEAVRQELNAKGFRDGRSGTDSGVFGLWHKYGEKGPFVLSNHRPNRSHNLFHL